MFTLQEKHQTETEFRDGIIFPLFSNVGISDCIFRNMYIVS